MKKALRKLAVMAAALAVSFQAVQAGEDSKVESKTASEQLDGYATGWNVGVFGGANLFQSGRVAVTSPALPGVSAPFDTRSQLNGVAGAEGGYTWSDLKLTDAVAIMPALDGEFFYTGSDYKGTGSIAGISDKITTTLDTYVFSVDPKLKFQIGRFRPYVGFGLGAAYMTGNSGSLTVGPASASLAGHTDDVVLALQGLAGLETFVTKHWAIDVDYKYLDLVDPTFGGSALHYQGHSLTEHILTAGAKFYF